MKVARIARRHLLRKAPPRARWKPARRQSASSISSRCTADRLPHRSRRRYASSARRRRLLSPQAGAACVAAHAFAATSPPSSSEMMRKSGAGRDMMKYSARRRWMPPRCAILSAGYDAYYQADTKMRVAAMAERSAEMAAAQGRCHDDIMIGRRHQSAGRAGLARTFDNAFPALTRYSPSSAR